MFPKSILPGLLMLYHGNISVRMYILSQMYMLESYDIYIYIYMYIYNCVNLLVEQNPSLFED